MERDVLRTIKKHRAPDMGGPKAFSSSTGKKLVFKFFCTPQVLNFVPHQFSGYLEGIVNYPLEMTSQEADCPDVQ